MRVSSWTRISRILFGKIQLAGKLYYGICRPQDLISYDVRAAKPDGWISPEHLLPIYYICIKKVKCLSC
jgi:hypothetical protein